MSYIPVTENEKVDFYSITLKQILESNATAEEKAAAKACLDAIMSYSK